MQESISKKRNFSTQKSIFLSGNKIVRPKPQHGSFGKNDDRFHIIATNNDVRNNTSYKNDVSLWWQLAFVQQLF